jgi:DNA (cytosine-5)-methyltransferase 1
MSAPRLLDLFCGAGGAGTGYARAGFDVVGVDRVPQPRYPFPFHQADALDVLTAPTWRAFLDGFAAVHASPPCQTHSSLAALPHVRAGIDAGRHLDLVAPVRDALHQWADRTGGVWVMENVPGAPLRAPLTLCGTEFALTTRSQARGLVWLRRHRLFESNTWLMGAGGCHCNTVRGRVIGVYGHGDGGGRGWKGTFTDRKAVMGIDWMTRDELAQAIPPAYTHHIGDQLIRAIEGTHATTGERTTP